MSNNAIIFFSNTALSLLLKMSNVIALAATISLTMIILEEMSSIRGVTNIVAVMKEFPEN